MSNTIAETTENKTKEESSYLYSRGYSYYIFTLLFLLYMFDYIDRLVVVSLFPFLKEEWGITDTQSGLLSSAVYWSIVLFTFPISILVDRWSRKKSIGIMSLIWALATLACAFTQNFKQLFTARTVIGIGEAGYAPGGTAMISAVFPEKKRALMLGIWNASIPLGSAIGIVLGGVIADHLGWRYAFGLVGIPGIIIAILMFFVRDYKTVELTKTLDKVKVKMKAKDIAKDFIHTKSLIFSNLAFAASVFVTTSLMVWLPTYFHRVQNISITEASSKSGVIIFLAFLGAPLGGFLANKWYLRNKRGKLYLPALTALLSGGLLFAAFALLQDTLQYIALLLSGITVTCFIAAAVSVTQDVVHPGLRAVSLSICVVVQNILGSSLGPIFVGVVSDASDIQTGLTLLPIFSLIAAVLFLIGSLFYEEELQRVEKVEIVPEDVVPVSG